jgi:hypothetical protein
MCNTSADGWGIFFCKYFYKSVAYLIKSITFAYTKTTNKMKTTITYSVSDLMSFKTWEQAIAFANRINYKFIKVTGTKGAKQVEKGYTIDTWKNAKQIKNDIIFEL